MLVSTVETAWRARRAGALGVTGTEGLGLDWGAVIGRKRRIVAEWSHGKETGLAGHGITVLRGRAVFRGPHALEVDGRPVTAERVVVATGSSPVRPPLEGIELALTSDGLLDRPVRPERLVVIGGGYVGLELAFAFGRAGSRVTVLQSGPRVLPAVDDELRAALLELAPAAGLTVHTGARVTRIAPDRTVEAEIGGATRRFPADAVLAATGRRPNTAGLGLEATGATVDQGVLRVNEYRQSVSASHLYAAGDVTGEHQHTPAAWYEGTLAAENALRGNRRAVDFRIFPTTVFTIPALAQVGLTEAEARRQGLEVAVSRAPFADSAAAGVRDEAEGLVKVVAEAGTGRLLGVHILGPAAEELIHVAAVAMRGGLTRGDLAATHYVFPTLAGSVFDAMWA